MQGQGAAGAATPGTASDVRAATASADHAGAPLADLCGRDPLDLDADPRTAAVPPPAPLPCGPLCTPWCLAGHAGVDR